jgi:polyphosphate kinase
LSENITVRSIVGRLLEHSRVYYFENGGDEKLLIGSSDWMPRNLDRRVEVLTPVESAEIKRYLKDRYLATYLHDNVKAWRLNADGKYEKIIAERKEELINAQEKFGRASNLLDFDGPRSN